MQTLLACAPPGGADEELAEARNPYHRQRAVLEQLTKLGEHLDMHCRRALEQERERQRLLEQGVEDFPQSSVALQPGLEHALQTLMRQWTEFYVENMAEMRAILDLRLTDGRAYTTTLGTDVFFELSRMHWLLEQPRLCVEWENLHLIDADQLDPTSYDLLFSLALTKSDVWINVQNSLEKEQLPAEDASEQAVQARELLERVRQLWRKPIAQYTMSQTRVLAMFLTQQINDVRAHELEEYRRVARILWTRCAFFIVRLHGEDEWFATLDEPEFRALKPRTGEAVQGPQLAACNRKYFAFCSFYLGEVLRRCFHYDLIAPNVLLPVQLPSLELMGRMRERMFGWISRITDGLAIESFEEMFMGLVSADDGGYAFPGDEHWFRYAFPERVMSRGACITTLRPHMHSRFYSETEVDRQVVLRQCGKSHLARLFVLHSLQEHIKLTHPRVEFIAGVVVDNDGIEQSAHIMTGFHAPLLIQVFASFWVYHQGHVYPSDDIYLSLALWWWFLREHYQSKLYKVDMSAFMEDALEPPERRPHAWSLLDDALPVHASSQPVEFEL